MRPSWWFVVPVRRAGGSKSRLSHLSAADRRDLTTAFAQDTLSAVLNAESAAGVVVVGDLPREDIPDSALAEQPAVLVLPDPGVGLNGAITAATAAVPSGAPVAAILGDLPALTPADIDRALSAAARADRSFVCDADGIGTTLLASRHGSALDPRFGPRSRAAHARSGAQEILDPKLARLRRDVDTDVDLWDARRLGVGPATARVLARLA